MMLIDSFLAYFPLECHGQVKKIIRKLWKKIIYQVTVVNTRLLYTVLYLDTVFLFYGIT